MQKIKNILLWIWQLPQNLIGFILTRRAKQYCDFVCNDYEMVRVYYTNNVFGCGVSLGKYIILDYKNYWNKPIYTTVCHEHGHQKQSRYLGLFYLLVVGFTSAICNNLWDRLFHKKWSNKKRMNWYYSRFPENWADKLGGVKR